MHPRKRIEKIYTIAPDQKIPIFGIAQETDARSWSYWGLSAWVISFVMKTTHRFEKFKNSTCGMFFDGFHLTCSWNGFSWDKNHQRNQRHKLNSIPAINFQQPDVLPWVSTLEVLSKIPIKSTIITMIYSRMCVLRCYFVQANEIMKRIPEAEENKLSLEFPTWPFWNQRSVILERRTRP